MLYVGKAKNLKNRISSYTHIKQLVPRIQRMVLTAQELKFQVRESELEALLVEAELIRMHQPEANVLLKDDKSALYLHITNDKFPRVLPMRKREMITSHPKGTILGPFSSAYKLAAVLKIVRPIFPWCNQTPSETAKHHRCFYYHLQLCPGACVGDITAEEYQAYIKHLVLFLRGKTKDVLSQMKLEMTQAVADQAFEKAAELRDQIQLIKTATLPQKKFSPLLALPVLKSTMAEEKIVRLAELLSNYMGLPKAYPLTRIEGYDVSNTQGTNPSVAMVTFIEGRATPSEYRLFNIRSLQTPNDYGMMKEALIRRQNHPEWGQPNLVVIDGGKGQLRAALSVWQWGTPVISIAKNPDRIIIPIRNEIGLNSKDKYHVLTLPSNHPALQLIQEIRNESHRFSKKQHTRRRLKEMLKG